MGLVGLSNYVIVLHVAQRLGATIYNTNELVDYVDNADDHRYKDLFRLMTFPCTILQDTDEPTFQYGHVEVGQPFQEVDSGSVQFMERFKQICMPTWKDLLQNVYKAIQQKYGNANAAMNILASSIRKGYHPQVPFMW